MVQFKHNGNGHKISAHAQEVALRDDYWKLGFEPKHTVDAVKQELKENGYRCRWGDKKAKVLVILGRYQRELPEYRNFDLATLESFYAARSLPPTTVHLTQKKIVRALERADDEATFDKFMDLPPELRNTIYAFYFEDLGTLPVVHRQPPLTLASSQLRKESLSMFYSHANFKAVFSVPNTRGVLAGNQKARFDAATTAMLEGLSEAHFALIRRLELWFRNGPDSYALYEQREHWYSIDVGFARIRDVDGVVSLSSPECAHVSISHRLSVLNPLFTPAAKSSLEEAIHRLFRDMKPWEEDFKLQKGFITPLSVLIFNAAFEQPDAP